MLPLQLHSGFLVSLGYVETLSTVQRRLLRLSKKWPKTWLYQAFGYFIRPHISGFLLVWFRILCLVSLVKGKR